MLEASERSNVVFEGRLASSEVARFDAVVEAILPSPGLVEAEDASAG